MKPEQYTGSSRAFEDGVTRVGGRAILCRRAFHACLQYLEH